MKRKTYLVTWENRTTKEWDKPIQRTTEVEALDRLDAMNLIVKAFGNYKKIHITKVDVKDAKDSNEESGEIDQK